MIATQNEIQTELDTTILPTLIISSTIVNHIGGEAAYRDAPYILFTQSLFTGEYMWKPLNSLAELFDEFKAAAPGAQIWLNWHNWSDAEVEWLQDTLDASGLVKFDDNGSRYILNGLDNMYKLIK